MKRALLPFFTIFLLVCCTTTRYIPAESVHKDSIFISKLQRDSIYVRDSVFMTVKADTVFLSRIHYRYRDRVLRDTVSVMQCDTITKYVEVEKPLSYWQKKKILLGEVALWLIPLIVVLIFFLRK